MSSLLEALEAICNVNVDDVNPKTARSLPFKPHNRMNRSSTTSGQLVSDHLLIDITETSNQVICCDFMLRPENRESFIEKMVQFCADNLQNITGRVLVQVSPANVYDKNTVLKQCHAYDRAFKDAGVSRDHYAIKISATGPAMVAANELNAEGIRILATSIFSLPQAIAASQAGCLFVSAYSDDSLMHKSDDPALTHPMAPRIVQILDTYAKLYRETGKEQPLIVMASNANIGEIIANAELGCQHITILSHHLKELAETPVDDGLIKRYPILGSHPAKKQPPYYANATTPERVKGHLQIDPLAGPDWNGELASTKVDWLADDGKALSEAMSADAAVVRKMADVMGAFGGADEKAKAAIEAEAAKLGL
ncbi:hypothetical protein F5883DRAFT_633662 [Diaporthe sp. PMI_573]|nr:hypothetical protein F5883DRAFT_633662 [Diaporthaceae sp. PMI_573]